MGIIDGRFTKKNNGILSYLTNQQDQDYYEYEQLKKRQTSLQKQTSQHHGLFPQPSIQRPPQVSGNASAFACLAIAIIKITGLAAVAVASAL